MNIRLYKREDFPTINSWSLMHHGKGISENMFSETTFILENEEGNPWVCWTLFLTNSKNVCWIEGLMSNPFLKEHRREAVKELHSYIVKYAKEKGYTKMLGFANTPGICKMIEDDLGYKKTTDLIGFIRDLGE